MRRRELLALTMLSAVSPLLADWPAMKRLDRFAIAPEATRRMRVGHFLPSSTLLVFFEDQCSYCLDMLRTGAVWRDARPSGRSLLAIGVGNDASALKNWVAKAKVEAPVLQANGRLIADVGGVSVTPTSRLLTAAGYGVRIVGAVNIEKLNLALS